MSRRAINQLREMRGDFVMKNLNLNVRNTYTYITVAGSQDLSGLDVGNHTVMVNVALTNGQYIRLPEATTDNGGMKITVIVGIVPADNAYVGFVTTNMVGGIIGISDGDQGLGSTNSSSQVSVVGTGNKSVILDANGDADDGSGMPGTILEFWYTGAANVVVYRGTLIGDVDSATNATHFSTTTVIAH